MLILSKTFSKRLGVVLAAGAFVAGCGDNWHGGSSGGPDASHIDAGGDGGQPDAGPDASTPPTVSGTIAVNDVDVLDPAAVGSGGFSGGSIGITFLDLGTNDGGTVTNYGSFPFNGCVVTEYDSTHLPNPPLDEGAITVANQVLTVAAAPNGATRTSNVVTITTTAPHHQNVGDFVTIGGVADNSFNGRFQITSVPSTTKFTYDQNGSDTGTGSGGGTVAVENGLLKTVGPCVFNNQLEQYVCVSNSDTLQTVAAQDLASNGEVAYAWPGTCTTAATPCFFDAQCVVGGDTCDGTGPFAGENLVGSYLQINGMGATPGVFDSGPTSAFPILAQPNSRTLVVVNPAPANGASTLATATAQENVLNGYAPVPAAGGAVDTNFLGKGGIHLNVLGGGHGDVHAFNRDVDVPGEGFKLADSSADPTAFPLATASDQAYTCSGTGGDCGDGSTNILQAFILSGRATLGAVGGTCDTANTHTCTAASNGRDGLACATNADCSLLPFQMPTDAPGDHYIEFQCSVIGGTTVTLPSAAVQQIIDLSPTRVEVRVINAAGDQIADGPNKWNLVVGHAVVGHTDNN